MNLKEAILSSNRSKVIDNIVKSYYIDNPNLGYFYINKYLENIPPFSFYYKIKKKLKKKLLINKAYKNYNRFFESIKDVSPSFIHEENNFIVIPYLYYEEDDSDESKDYSYLSISSYKVKDLKEFKYYKELDDIKLEDIDSMNDEIDKVVDIVYSTILPQRWSYMMDRWENTLASIIDIEAFKRIGMDNIIPTCIYEMTYLGYTKEEIDKKLDKLKEEYEREKKVVEKIDDKINEEIEDEDNSNYIDEEEDTSTNSIEEDIKKRYALVSLKCLKSEYDAIKDYCERMRFV